MHRRGLSVLLRPTKLPAAGYSSSSQYKIVFGTHECEIAFLTDAEVTENVYKSDHTVSGDSNGCSAQTVVIMKLRMETYRKTATTVGSLWIISQATGMYFGVIPDCSMVWKILLIMLSVMSCF